MSIGSIMRVFTPHKQYSMQKDLSPLLTEVFQPFSARKSSSKVMHHEMMVDFCLNCGISVSRLTMATNRSISI